MLTGAVALMTSREAVSLVKRVAWWKVGVPAKKETHGVFHSINATGCMTERQRAWCERWSRTVRVKFSDEVPLRLEASQQLFCLLGKSQLLNCFCSAIEIITLYSKMTCQQHDNGLHVTWTTMRVLIQTNINFMSGCSISGVFQARMSFWVLNCSEILRISYRCVLSCKL